MTDYARTSYDAPPASASTDLSLGGLNNADDFVGYTGYYLSNAKGFIHKGNTYVDLNYPGAITTTPSDINDSRQVVGSYRLETETSHGFLLDGATFKTIDVPGSRFTEANGISNSGTIVGDYVGADNRFSAFSYSNGQYTSFKVPGSSSTSASGVNDSGQIVGSYEVDDDRSTTSGFIYSNGKFQTVTYPGASDTRLNGINNNGKIIGEAWIAVNGNTNDLRITNFTYKDGTFTAISSTDGANPARVTGINDSDQLVGLVPNAQNKASPSLFTENVPCFVAGTLIRTPTGDVPVESLAVGDLVVTATGAARPVRWLGHRTLSCTRHSRPEAIWPVRVLAGAFGPGLPRRDLWLSPDHAVCVTVLDAVLIPVKHLLNDATITQVPRNSVTYWHVELDSHDILLAEGLPAESFLDTGVRAGFANGGEHMILHPDFAPLALTDFCRPLVQEGPIVDAVRTRLLARAQAEGWTLTADDDLHLVADGTVIRPVCKGATAHFTLAADARDVRLMSRSFVPERVRVGAGDGRRLGVPLRAVAVIDGEGVTRNLPIDSALLADGFSFVQDATTDAWRWTTGAAVLPVALWAGCAGTITLVIETAPDRGTLEAWLAPVAAAVEDALYPAVAA